MITIIVLVGVAVWIVANASGHPVVAGLAMLFLVTLPLFLPG
jgi:hypothetical protein